MRAVALASALLLGGCAGLEPARESLDVREVGRSPYCNTPGEAPQVALLPDARAVADWQAARGITLTAEPLAPVAYALVEMGLRPTGGYGLSVSAAALQGDVVVLTAAFTAPAPGSLRTQALSSPCVLVQLPTGRYSAVEVRDAAGVVHARSGAPPVPAGALER